MTTLFFIHLIELLAFLAGIFYYRRNKSRPNYYLVWFLGFTFCVEILGWYVYFVPDGFLSFIKDTSFESNHWLFNICTIISFVFYISYFKWHLQSKRDTIILNSCILVFLIVSILEILISDGFFNRDMPIVNILGTIIVFLSIAFYYLQLLRSDQILEIHKSLIFYISIGTLFFYLCTTPLFIYSSYYSSSIDPSFIGIYSKILHGTNYLLYGIYILGFLVCVKHEKPIVL